LIGESRAAGLSVLPPDVNDYGYKFTVVDGAVRFGLGAVKGLGQAAIDSIVEARKEGPFVSLFDFCERVDAQKVNRRVVESLIKCGAFDKSGGADRAVMVMAIDEALEASARAQRDRKDGQSNMFDLLAETEGAAPVRAWPKAEPWRENVRLAFEKEALGFFITGHPLARYDMELGVVSSATADEARRKPDKTEVRLGGVVARVQTKLDKKGKKFAYVTLEDLSGSAELLVWADVYEKSAELLKLESVVLVIGQVDAGEQRPGQAKAGEQRSGQAKIIAREIMSLADAVERRTRTIDFKLPRVRLTDEILAFLQGVCQTYPGTARACLHLADGDGVAVYQLREQLKPCRELIESARLRLGPASLELR
ncbi:MAG: DNA polymerase III subunit alpha, partial [Candidatus Adiutrix sp.]|nr:DNA polymerase III subunit alpha [Candidatus Adiutrix sp.]